MPRYASVATLVVLREKSRALPKATVYDFLTTMTRNWANVVKVVKNPKADIGIANKLDLTVDYFYSPEKSHGDSTGGTISELKTSDACLTNLCAAGDRAPS